MENLQELTIKYKSLKNIILATDYCLHNKLRFHNSIEFNL